jgi:hypothetical protein
VAGRIAVYGIYGGILCNRLRGDVHFSSTLFRSDAREGMRAKRDGPAGPMYLYMVLDLNRREPTKHLSMPSVRVIATGLNCLPDNLILIHHSYWLLSVLLPCSLNYRAHFASIWLVSCSWCMLPQAHHDRPSRKICK